MVVCGPLGPVLLCCGAWPAHRHECDQHAVHAAAGRVHAVAEPVPSRPWWRIRGGRVAARPRGRPR